MLLDRYRVAADPLRTERRVELVLLLFVALLLLALLYQGVRLVLADEVEPLAPAPDSVRVADLVRPAAPAPEARRELLQRPLFWSERAPPAPVEDVAEAEPEPEEKARAARRMKGVTVSGVYGSGDSGGAIIALKDRELRLAVGDEVQGWRLAEVTGQSAVFVSGAARDERELVPAVIAVSEPAEDSGGARAAVPDADTRQSVRPKDRLTLGGGN